MATKPKTYPYAIYYSDNSYMIYDLTQTDFDTLATVMVAKGVATLSIGLIDTVDVRSVIKQKPPEKVKPTESASPELSLEELDWIKKQEELREMAEAEMRGYS